MLRKVIVVLCLLGSGPVWSNECFDFDKIFLSGESEAEVTEKLLKLRHLLVKFFYVKGEYEGAIPNNIAWSTARELSRYLEREGLDIRVREDLFNRERESLFSVFIGGALVAGYTLGTYGSPKIKELFQKFFFKRKAAVGIGVAGGAGTVLSSWLGGRLIPEGSCELLFSRSFFGDTVPLKDLGVESIPVEEPPAAMPEGDQEGRSGDEDEFGHPGMG